MSVTTLYVERFRGGWTAIFFSCLLSIFAAPAGAADISIKEQQSCQLSGLDASPETAQDGVHCLDKDTETPFSLSDILDGTIDLYVGDSNSPSWNVINDTGAHLDSLTLYFVGTLHEDSDLDLKLEKDGPKSWFDDCMALVYTTNDCYGKEALGPINLPLMITWNVGQTGSGLATGQIFNIRTGSFGHSGEDAGCISGTVDCMSRVGRIPEPGALMLLGIGLAALGLPRRRRHC